MCRWRSGACNAACKPAQRGSLLAPSAPRTTRNRASATPVPWRPFSAFSRRFRRRPHRLPGVAGEERRKPRLRLAGTPPRLGNARIRTRRKTARPRHRGAGAGVQAAGTAGHARGALTGGVPSARLKHRLAAGPLPPALVPQPSVFPGHGAGPSGDGAGDEARVPADPRARARVFVWRLPHAENDGQTGCQRTVMRHHGAETSWCRRRVAPKQDRDGEFVRLAHRRRSPRAHLPCAGVPASFPRSAEPNTIRGRDDYIV